METLSYCLSLGVWVRAICQSLWTSVYCPNEHVQVWGSLPLATHKSWRLKFQHAQSPKYESKRCNGTSHKCFLHVFGSKEAGWRRISNSSLLPKYSFRSLDLSSSDFKYANLGAYLLVSHKETAEKEHACTWHRRRQSPQYHGRDKVIFVQCF